MTLNPMTAPRRLGLLLAGLGVAALAGCGLFDIRDPIPPDTGGCPRHTPSTVDSVVFNFESALGCKVGGTTNLQEALGAPFQFVLDPIDVSSVPQRPDSMTKTVTLNAFDTFYQGTVKNDSLYMRIFYQDLPPGRDQDLPDGRHWFDRVNYELRIIARGDTVVKATYAGIATIYFRTGSGTWTFDRWQDRGTGGSTPSLGAVLGDAVGR